MSFSHTEGVANIDESLIRASMNIPLRSTIVPLRPLIHESVHRPSQLKTSDKSVYNASIPASTPKEDLEKQSSNWRHHAK